MKKITFYFLIILNFSYSQKSNIDYYLNLDKVKTNQEKLKICLEMEKDGFINNFTSISNYYYSLKKDKLGFKYLKKAIEFGQTLDNEQLIAGVPEKDLIQIKKLYQKLRLKFYLGFDEKLCEEIKYLYNPDQYLATENFYGGRKAQYPIREKIFQNNLTHFRRYLSSYNKGQLPQYKQVGSLTRDVVVMLLHHTRLDSIDEVNYNYFEPILKQEVLLRKTYKPTTYIQFVDNMQQVMEEGKPQVYGHFRNFKTNKICLLKYPEKADSLRAAIGLQPLKDYALKMGFSLPDNYIEQ